MTYWVIKAHSGRKEQSCYLVLYAADGDPQQLCCVHSILLQTGAVSGTCCNRGEGRALLVLTNKDQRSRRPILTNWVIHKTQWYSIAEDKVYSSVIWRKLLVRLVMTAMEPYCILMIEYSTVDRQWNHVNEVLHIQLKLHYLAFQVS